MTGGVASRIETGVLPARWAPPAPDCVGVPAFHVHEYNPTFVILRQSGCTHFEEPFLCLLLGTRGAMLIDTGAGGAPLAPVVFDVLDRPAGRTGRRRLSLLVVHSHAHSDHVAGDGEFRDVPGVRFVEPSEEAVRALFGLRDRPEGASGKASADPIAP